jgi:propanediol utilization protein
MNGERKTLFYDVQIRVHQDFRLEMHIDTDDANAAGVANGFKAKLLKR